MLPVDDAQTLALLYHLNSEPWAVEAIPEEIIYEVVYKDLGGAIALPEPELESHLGGLLRQRASCRRFNGSTMALSTVSELLAGAYGLTTLREFAGSPKFHARTVPSAGALYPLEITFAAERIEGLRDGLYHFQVRDHALEPIRLGSVMQEMASCLVGQDYVRGANLVVVFSGVFGRTLKKYGARGYRYVLFEAGHAAQNLSLLAAECGLGSLCLGGFRDREINHLLSIDGVEEASLYCIAVGSCSAEGAESAA